MTGFIVSWIVVVSMTILCPNTPDEFGRVDMQTQTLAVCYETSEKPMSKKFIGKEKFDEATAFSLRLKKECKECKDIKFDIISSTTIYP